MPDLNPGRAKLDVDLATGSTGQRPDLDSSAKDRIEILKIDAEVKLASSLLEFVRASHCADHRVAKRNLGTSLSLEQFFVEYAKAVFDANAEEDLAAIEKSGTVNQDLWLQSLRSLAEEVLQSMVSKTGVWRRTVAEVCESRSMGTEERGEWSTKSGTLVYSVAGLMRPRPKPLRFELALRVRVWKNRFLLASDQGRPDSHLIHDQAHPLHFGPSTTPAPSQETLAGPGDIAPTAVSGLIASRECLLSEYKSATGNPSNKKIYEATNSGIHKPEFYKWLKGTLSPRSKTSRNFERFLGKKDRPSPRKPRD